MSLSAKDSEALISLRSIVEKVEKLIKSKKYKQIRGKLSAGGCERCYLGLVGQVLVDEGLYEWKEADKGLESFFLKATEKGKTYGLPSLRTSISVPLFPVSVKHDGARWKIAALNDQYRLSYEKIHELVKAETLTNGV